MLSEFINITYCKNKLIDYLVEHCVLSPETNCDQCGSVVNLNKKKLMFTCQKYHFVKNAHKKRVMERYRFERSVKVGTWFSNNKIDMSIICRITAYFITFPPPRVKFLSLDTGLLSTTITLVYKKFFFQLLWTGLQKHRQKLGGPGHIVEIDEAKFGHRKYNRGRKVDGNWVFGEIDRESKKIFLIPVKDRTQDTLLECIKDNIEPGTTIMSDYWKSYNCLDNEDFQHLTVNYTYNFVDPDTQLKCFLKNLKEIYMKFTSILIFFTFCRCT
ncbi:hypothetical protein ALC57_10555 [Trachymyrmex cornetzi]|uniref:ISXO2-like transposase domain-containing protein n=1 Tax=Trachymyrmex cornetzi TaxID=471704 RepID=A0A151J408_9HYME|nr:hypothetical protein ALC57_10555 [Trachymyrmex cornetzi]